MPSSFSIITVCLSAEQTIRQTIDSVIGQNYPHIEYIIIDGGSDDSTLSIIEEYRDQISTVVSEADDGISDAFNKGIALATGDYIGIINADDYYEPTAFKTIADAIEHNDYPAVIHGSLRYIPSSGASYIEHPDVNRIWDYMSVFHPTMFISNKAYQAIGAYRLDFQYAMDSEWVHRALKNNLTFAQTDVVLSNMRLEGTSHNNMARSLNEFRQSSVSHNKRKILTTYYFARQLIIQSLINIKFIKSLMLKRKH
ncbi:MAG: glycosyltransferase involved in cell wall biosynthesis [Pseudomonadales bacterium]|jgi:glycosyltransferase involved in cell wall biosynthesis